MGKLHKVFKKAFDPLGIVKGKILKGKKNTAPPTAEAIAKKTALAATAVKRQTSANRLQANKVKNAGFGSAEDKNLITSPGARSSKLFGE